MAGKKKREQPEKRDASSYYKLNTKAVNDLVEADESNSPPVSQEELQRYRHGPRLKKPKIGAALRAFIVKWWFAGAVCYFFWWGLTMYVGSALDLFFIVSIALGIVTDVLTNSVLRAMGGNDRFMVFPRNTILSLFLNIVYSFILMLFVRTTYVAINVAWTAFSGNEDALLLDVAPITFGIFVAGWDMVFLMMKRGLQHIVGDAKAQAGTKVRGEPHV